MAPIPPKPTAEIVPLVVPGAALSPKDKRRAEAKYGKPVMGHGYTILPNLILQAQAKLKISPTAFNVLLHLVSHWWDADEAPHPSIATIARRMRKSPRSLFRYFDELEAAKLIERKHRYRGLKQQTTTAYVLSGLVAKLKEIEPEIAKGKKFKGKRLAAAETATSAA